MAGILTYFGERAALDAFLTTVQPLQARLIKAAWIPNPSQVVGDLVEADFPGYAALDLVYSGLEAGNPGGRAVADFDPVEWTCSANISVQLIYGYWIEDAAHNVVIQERFNGNPRPMRYVGDKVKLTTYVRLYNPS